MSNLGTIINNRPLITGKTARFYVTNCPASKLSGNLSGLPANSIIFCAPQNSNKTDDVGDFQIVVTDTSSNPCLFSLIPGDGFITQQNKFTLSLDTTADNKLVLNNITKKYSVDVTNIKPNKINF